MLALDGDPAGRAATARLRDQLGDAPLRVLRLPDHEDLTSLHVRRKDQSWLPPQTQTQTHTVSPSI